MTAILRNRKLVLVYPNSYYLPPRSEGRIKSYDSCTDLRAWSLHENERSDHLFDLIKIDNDQCCSLIPRNVLGEILSNMRGDNDLVTQYKSDVPRTSKLVGDSKSNERELKKNIAEKDSNIAALLKELNELKAKFKEKSDCTENEDEIKHLQAEIKRLLEENAKGHEKDKQIEDLERIIRELTSERNTLLKTNSELAKDLDEFKIHLECLSNLTNDLSTYANKAQSMDGKGQKYRQLLKTFKVAAEEDIAKAKTKEGELAKEKKQLEHLIKTQLDEALEMYITALEELQKKQLELDKIEKELAELKSKNAELLKKCAERGDVKPTKDVTARKLPVSQNKGISQESDKPTYVKMGTCDTNKCKCCQMSQRREWSNNRTDSNETKFNKCHSTCNKGGSMPLCKTALVKLKEQEQSNSNPQLNAVTTDSRQAKTNQIRQNNWNILFHM